MVDAQLRLGSVTAQLSDHIGLDEQVALSLERRGERWVVTAIRKEVDLVRRYANCWRAARDGDHRALLARKALASSIGAQRRALAIDTQRWALAIGLAHYPAASAAAPLRVLLDSDGLPPAERQRWRRWCEDAHGLTLTMLASRHALPAWARGAGALWLPLLGEPVRWAHALSECPGLATRRALAPLLAGAPSLAVAPASGLGEAPAVAMHATVVARDPRGLTLACGPILLGAAHDLGEPACLRLLAPSTGYAVGERVLLQLRRGDHGWLAAHAPAPHRRALGRQLALAAAARAADRAALDQLLAEPLDAGCAAILRLAPPTPALLAALAARRSADPAVAPLLRELQRRAEAERR